MPSEACCRDLQDALEGIAIRQFHSRIRSEDDREGVERGRRTIEWCVIRRCSPGAGQGQRARARSRRLRFRHSDKTSLWRSQSSSRRLK
jgi:hypothetical protein